MSIHSGDICDQSRKLLKMAPNFKRFLPSQVLQKHFSTLLNRPLGPKKFGELWSANQKVIGAHVDPPNWTFPETIFRPLGVLAPQIFTRPTSPINCISSQTWDAGQPQVGLCHIFLVLMVFVVIVLSIYSYMKFLLKCKFLLVEKNHKLNRKMCVGTTV